MRKVRRADPKLRNTLRVPVSRKYKLALRDLVDFDIIGSTPEEVAAYLIKCGIQDRTEDKDGRITLRVPAYAPTRDYLIAISEFGYMGDTPEEVAFYFIRKGIHEQILAGTITNFRKTRELVKQINQEGKKP